MDTGSDQRTVVSGIAEFYSPEEIIGKQVCLLANLAPRAIKGIESQGMVLMAESPDGKLSFVLPESVTPNGTLGELVVSFAHEYERIGCASLPILVGICP